MPPHEPEEASSIERALESVNAGYVAELYAQYRRDPTSVDPEWRSLFESGAGGFEPAPPAVPPSAGNGQADARPIPTGATPIKGAAARLAQNMTASLAVPTATSFRDLDVSVLEVRRTQLNAQVAPRRVSFTHLIGWAIVQAAREQPGMTHYFTEADGQAYRVDPAGVNLGLAVDVERADGTRFLVVPVIKGADGMDFAGFHARYEELVEKARANKLGADDFTGATITLTNPGTLGTTASVPRLMPNQGTIVATGGIRSVAGQRLMTITSTYDHRVIQGAESGAFLGRIDALCTARTGSTRSCSGRSAPARCRPPKPRARRSRRRPYRPRPHRPRPHRPSLPRATTTSRRSRRRWRWSRHIGILAIPPRTSIRSAASRSATRPSTRSRSA